MATITVNDSNAESHAARLIEMIQQRAQAALAETAEAMLASAKSRAPSMEEEYRELNAEAGSEPLTPMGADGSSADDDSRVRFSKEADTYLTNAVADPVRNAFVDETRLAAAVGNLEYLYEVTRFSYTNASEKSGEPRGTYEVGPYFDMFEGGTAGAAVDEDGVTTFEVEPHERREDGGYYPLRPGSGDDGVRGTMVKSITGRFMFNPLLLQDAASEVLRGAMAEVGPSAE